MASASVSQATSHVPYQVVSVKHEYASALPLRSSFLTSAKCVALDLTAITCLKGQSPLAHRQYGRTRLQRPFKKIEATLSRKYKQGISQTNVSDSLIRIAVLHRRASALHEQTLYSDQVVSNGASFALRPSSEIRERSSKLLDRVTVVRRDAERSAASGAGLPVHIIATTKSLEREQSSLENIMRVALGGSARPTPHLPTFPALSPEKSNLNQMVHSYGSASPSQCTPNSHCSTPQNTQGESSVAGAVKGWEDFLSQAGVQDLSNCMSPPPVASESPSPSSTIQAEIDRRVAELIATRAQLEAADSKAPSSTDLPTPFQRHQSDLSVPPLVPPPQSSSVSQREAQPSFRTSQARQQRGDHQHNPTMPSDRTPSSFAVGGKAAAAPQTANPSKKPSLSSIWARLAKQVSDSLASSLPESHHSQSVRDAFSAIAAPSSPPKNGTQIDQGLGASSSSSSFHTKAVSPWTRSPNGFWASPDTAAGDSLLEKKIGEVVEVGWQVQEVDEEKEMLRRELKEARARAQTFLEELARREMAAKEREREWVRERQAVGAALAALMRLVEGEEADEEEEVQQQGLYSDEGRLVPPGTAALVPEASGMKESTKGVSGSQLLQQVGELREALRRQRQRERAAAERMTRLITLMGLQLKEVVEEREETRVLASGTLLELNEVQRSGRGGLDARGQAAEISRGGEMPLERQGQRLNVLERKLSKGFPEGHPAPAGLHEQRAMSSGTVGRATERESVSGGRYSPGSSNSNGPILGGMWKVREEGAKQGYGGVHGVYAKGVFLKGLDEPRGEEGVRAAWWVDSPPGEWTVYEDDGEETVEEKEVGEEAQEVGIEKELAEEGEDRGLLELPKVEEETVEWEDAGQGLEEVDHDQQQQEEHEQDEADEGEVGHKDQEEHDEKHADEEEVSDTTEAAPLLAQSPSITIHYETGWDKVFLHFTADSQGWTTIPGVVMADSDVMGGNGRLLKVLTIQGSSLEFVVNNGDKEWDSSPFGGNYTIDRPGVYLLSFGVIKELLTEI